MVDFSRFLPLSNRPSGDESGVTSDRSEAIAAVIEEAARLVAAAPADADDALATRFARSAGVSATPEDDVDARGLAELAHEVRRGRRQRTAALARAVRALLVLADETGGTPRIADLTLGTVALYAATTASFDRRAVVAGHALRATDMDWQFGRGPVLEAPGLEIVRFLLGLSDVAPKPAAGDDRPGQGA